MKVPIKPGLSPVWKDPRVRVWEPKELWLIWLQFNTIPVHPQHSSDKYGRSHKRCVQRAGGARGETDSVWSWIGVGGGAQMEEVVTWIIILHPCAKNVRLC